GEGAGCRATKLQCSRRTQRPPPLVPPIVYDVLRSPGEPLAPATIGLIAVWFAALTGSAPLGRFAGAPTRWRVRRQIAPAIAANTRLSVSRRRSLPSRRDRLHIVLSAFRFDGTAVLRIVPRPGGW